VTSSELVRPQCYNFVPVSKIWKETGRPD
jgi:hypothetical protein